MSNSYDSNYYYSNNPRYVFDFYIKMNDNFVDQKHHLVTELNEHCKKWIFVIQGAHHHMDHQTFYFKGRLSLNNRNRSTFFQSLFSFRHCEILVPYHIPCERFRFYDILPLSEGFLNVYDDKGHKGYEDLYVYEG
jgi:hypothetical protein